MAIFFFIIVALKTISWIHVKMFQFLTHDHSLKVSNVFLENNFTFYLTLSFDS